MLARVREHADEHGIGYAWAYRPPAPAASACGDYCFPPDPACPPVLSTDSVAWASTSNSQRRHQLRSAVESGKSSSNASPAPGAKTAPPRHGRQSRGPKTIEHRCRQPRPKQGSPAACSRPGPTHAGQTQARRQDLLKRLDKPCRRTSAPVASAAHTPAPSRAVVRSRRPRSAAAARLRFRPTGRALRRNLVGHSDTPRWSRWCRVGRPNSARYSKPCLPTHPGADRARRCTCSTPRRGSPCNLSPPAGSAHVARSGEPARFSTAVTA